MADNCEKWIIDTDIGDDIDDAFALNYALAAGLNVIAITTVFRSSLLRAKTAKHLLTLCGADIPVFAGMDEPLQNDAKTIIQPERWLPEKELAKVLKTGEKWLPHYIADAEDAKVENINAVDAIINYAKEFKGSLCIMAIGPLTNLAAAIQKAPEICGCIKEIILMGGNAAEDIAEWNFRLDPEAAYNVLHSEIPIKLIGSDVTWKTCTMSLDDLISIKSKTGKKYSFINAMLEKWQNQPLYKGKTPCMHDSLPVAAVVNPDTVKFEQKYVRVGLCGNERAKIITEAEKTVKNTIIQAAVSADKEKFWFSFKKYL